MDLGSRENVSSSTLSAPSSSDGNSESSRGVSEDVLSNLSEELGNHRNLPQLALALGFRIARWNLYRASNTRRDGVVCSEGTFQMLCDWKMKTPKGEQRQMLVVALKDAGFAELVDKFFPETLPRTCKNFERNNRGMTVTDEQLIELSLLFPYGKFFQFTSKIGVAYNEAQSILTKHQKDYGQALLDILMSWKNRRGRSFSELAAALRASELTRLVSRIGMDHEISFDNSDTIAEDLMKGKAPCNRTRIMVVGPAGVGKTSFINRLTNQSFDQEEKSTVGTVNTHTTSQWKLETVPRDELAESLARRQNAFREERKHVETTSHLPLQTAEKVSSLGVEDERSESNEGIEEAKEYAKGIPLERIHNVTSSANDIVYSIWDFGGQEIYYITHPLFLSWRSLYIAVFPLHKKVTKHARREEGQLKGCPTKKYRTMLDLMHFWMMSIYIHAVPPHNMEENGDRDPKILLVGTFCSRLKSKFNRSRNIAKLQNMIKDKPYSSQVIPSVVQVDNKSSSADKISQIQKEIDDLIASADYMKEELPVKWRIFLDQTKDLHQDTLKLTEARKIMSKIGIRDDKEVQDVLRFCHDAGHLIYHQGCELIILHPEVLNSFVSKIITVITDKKRHGDLGEHWDRLQKKGVLSMDLIKAVWKQHKGKDDELDMVIKMMIKFHLMCEIHDSKEVYQGRHFFVPCRSSPTLHLEEQHRSDAKFQFIIQFKYLLPDGFLHRLYVRMAEWAMDNKGPEDPSFHCREMLFYIDERHRVIMSNDIEGDNARKIKVTIYAISAGDRPDPNAEVNFQCSFMKYLEDTLKELKETWARRITYAVGIECPKCHRIVRLAKFRDYTEIVPCDHNSCPIPVSKVPECIRRSSVDSRTSGSTGLLGDARRQTVESEQRSVQPCQPSSSSTSASLHGQQEICDIYLVYSQETRDVENVKAIIHRNGWKMTTPADSRLGVPKMDSIEEALKTCSHVILVITEEDCRKNDSERTMTINMAFQSSSEKGMAGRVIPIRCCDEKHLPNKLKSLTNACVIDANLEDRLKKSINVRKKREGISGGSDDSSQPSASSN